MLPQIGIYCMSKAGVVQMTKAMAVEWGKYNINVNAICPGYISTEINEDYFDTEHGKKLIGMLPRKRRGQAGGSGWPAVVAGRPRSRISSMGRSSPPMMG